MVRRQGANHMGHDCSQVRPVDRLGNAKSTHNGQDDADVDCLTEDQTGILLPSCTECLLLRQTTEENLKETEEWRDTQRPLLSFTAVKVINLELKPLAVERLFVGKSA